MNRMTEAAGGTHRADTTLAVTEDADPVELWSNDELRRISGADELRVSARRPDGALREPTTIWVVPLDGHLYVRAAYGTGTAWWRAVRRAGRGRVWAGGVEKDVTFTTAAPELNDGIDDAYRTKYRRYSATLVSTMTMSDARTTTLELKPRATT